MLFITFNPSVRKTWVFQKKIKQFNVEFIEIAVIPQYVAKVEMPKVNVVSLKLIFTPTYTNHGMHNVT
jgi:hypothetical protein